NVTALTDLTRAFLPGMVARRSGRILNVASTAAFQPGPFMAVYYASKAYVLSFSEALHDELRGTGVTVTCLAPGPTATGFQARAGVEGVRVGQAARAMPDARTVAEVGVRAMHAGRRLVVPGVVNRIGTILAQLAPRGLAIRFIRGIQEARGEQKKAKG
ncbi:MAG TPA: SDR family NAD(P)-dependent oxidoreductase, partial [Rhodothermales bacterium]|nr:SDR family NAD(P)-dependent oxidoreductase [Rhodothermales bacterium]